jgi:hypothetical protein
MEDRIPAIKDKYNLRDEMGKVYPDNFPPSKGTWARCPYCTDSGGSALANEERFTCFQCGESLSVIDFFMKENGWSLPEAINNLAGDDLQIAPKKEKKEPAIIRPTSNFYEAAIEFHKQFDQAMQYFHNRSVTDKIGRIHLLGQHEKVVTLPYVDTNNNPHWIEHLRYVIPWIRNNIVVSLNMRRDDLWVASEVAKGGNFAEMFDRLKLDFIKKTGLQESDPAFTKKLAEALLGPKYFRRGSTKYIFNSSRIVRIHEDNKGWDPLPLPYCLITEGEVDSMSLESSGYPAIAAKNIKGMPFERILSLIPQVFVIQDIDKDMQRADGSIVNPGVMYAEATAGEINKRIQRAKIIKPPDGFKDANEVVVAGEVKNWLEQIGISPILL